MEYSRIVAVTGLPGLYEILNSKNDGAIVRSLDDNSTKFVSARVHNLTHLESIEIYTTGENVNLSDVFAAMKGDADPQPDIKDNKALQAYFKKVYPQLDFDRVYASDMKKIVNWFKVVQQHNIDFTVKLEVPEEETETAQPTETPEATEATKVAEPSKKAGKKPAAEIKEEAPAEAEKPKTRKKKKSEE